MASYKYKTKRRIKVDGVGRVSPDNEESRAMGDTVEFVADEADVAHLSDVLIRGAKVADGKGGGKSVDDTPRDKQVTGTSTK